ncbi:MAG TPA: phosphatidylserine decarboxylase, partial [Terracidiphilus sp.]|nr:phosphatidylserine decarboxylase [Terracidiphilus sp.]
LARRIVFNLSEGDPVARGQRVGLIKFGSRVDVVIPAEAALRVKVGERVKGGSSVLAALPVVTVVEPALEMARGGTLVPGLPGGERL